MNKAEKIRAKVERLMHAYNLSADIGSTGELYDEKIEEAKYEVCKQILSFIDSTPDDTVSEDLEEKILNVWEDDPHNKWPKCPYQDFKNIALHFANWQKNQILNNNIADYVVFQKYIGKIGIEAVISKPGYKTVWDADKIKIIAIEKDKL